jgi:hypothetical protein
MKIFSSSATFIMLKREGMSLEDLVHHIIPHHLLGKIVVAGKDQFREPPTRR